MKHHRHGFDEVMIDILILFQLFGLIQFCILMCQFDSGSHIFFNFWLFYVWLGISLNRLVIDFRIFVFWNSFFLWVFLQIFLVFSISLFDYLSLLLSINCSLFLRRSFYRHVDVRLIFVLALLYLRILFSISLLFLVPSIDSDILWCFFDRLSSTGLSFTWFGSFIYWISSRRIYRSCEWLLYWLRPENFIDLSFSLHWHFDSSWVHVHFFMLHISL